MRNKHGDTLLIYYNLYKESLSYTDFYFKWAGRSEEIVLELIESCFLCAVHHGHDVPTLKFLRISLLFHLISAHLQLFPR